MDPAPEFSVTRRRVGATVVVAPAGEIDLATVDAVKREIEAAGEHVVLDLREVTFIDSAGLRLVLECSRAVPEFAVVPGPREVRRVFDLVGLGERVPMLDAPPDG